MAAVEIRPVRNRAELAAFIDLPWHLYRDDPNWVPPLKSSVRELLDPARHPFYGGGSAAQRELFLAWDGRRPVGRVAAILNHAHNRFHRENVGFFGFFECEDRQDVASGLLRAACEWLSRFGLSAVRGPVNPSTNYESGLLVKGFDGPPVIMMTYNPPYYERLLEAFGLGKVKDLYAYWSPVHGGHLERLERANERVRRREPGLTTRGANLKDFRNEVGTVQEIYNSAWEKNWGFIPMSEGEIEWMARELKPLVQADLLRFAHMDGEPAGFLLALPDWNPVLARLDGSPWKHPLRVARIMMTAKPERMQGLRLITMGVKEKFRKRGIEGVLFAEGLRTALNIGYEWCEYSWILEDNELAKRTVRVMDAELYRIYRIYEKPLT
jgi:GNAT superfamily N-acetyltransferase